MQPAPGHREEQIRGTDEGVCLLCFLSGGSGPGGVRGRRGFPMGLHLPACDMEPPWRSLPRLPGPNPDSPPGGGWAREHLLRGVSPCHVPTSPPQTSSWGLLPGLVFLRLLSKTPPTPHRPPHPTPPLPLPRLTCSGPGALSPRLFWAHQVLSHHWTVPWLLPWPGTFFPGGA